MRAFLTGLAATALIATSAMAAGVPASVHNAKQTQKAVATALASPARADQAADDTRRKAAEVLAFSGVGPGDEVLDFLPGSGYWTRVFSGIVGASGHIYAVWPGPMAKYAVKGAAALEDRHLPNVTVNVLRSGIVAASEPVDLVWSVQNYHDLANDGAGEAGIDRMNAEAFKALKPGGIYLVIDHADAAGTGLTGSETKHRIDPAVVKTEVAKAGFQFVGESDALRNPADDHSLKVFDPAIRGHTDQFVFKFRKPR